MSEEEVQRLLGHLRAPGNQAQAAMRRLHAEFQPRIHAFAYSRLRRAEDADEVVVETLLEVWRKAASFRGDSRFSTWLLGIAKYKVLDHLRHDTRAHEDVDELDDALEDESALSAFDLIAERQRAAGVRQCLERLSAEQRECLHLVYFEDLGLRDVANLQGVPEGTVKTRLFHARQRIRGCLGALRKREGSDAR